MQSLIALIEFAVCSQGSAPSFAPMGVSVHLENWITVETGLSALASADAQHLKESATDPARPLARVWVEKA